MGVKKATRHASTMMIAVAQDAPSDSPADEGARRVEAGALNTVTRCTSGWEELRRNETSFRCIGPCIGVFGGGALRLRPSNRRCAMRSFRRACCLSAEQIDARAADLAARAAALPNDGEAQRAILKEIAQLRVDADARRWMVSPELVLGT
jgi:hypothetical protein